MKETNNKLKLVQTRVTAEQLEIIKKKAEARGMSVASYIRMKTLED